MLKMSTLILGTIISSIAFANTSIVDCASKSRTIAFSVGGESEGDTVRIKYEEHEKSGVYEAPILLLPNFNDNIEMSNKTIIALPVTNKKILSEKNLRLLAIHKDGTSCYERQSWDTHYTQKLLFSGKNGETLKIADVLLDKRVKGMNDDGYIVADFSCYAYGVAVANDCNIEEGDTLIWKKF